MPTSGQIRGMLLEEALLFLLRKSGYQTINTVDKKDKTLSKTGAGLQVRGRAVKHQIDAIADYTITPPFSYPNRLLVEAKNYSGTVGIEIVRNALGTIRDIEEYWIPAKKSIPFKKRHHYQYAIATTGKFSPDAEKFAFAHDIYLIPLSRDRYFKPIILAINSFSDKVKAFNTESPLNLKKLRDYVREKLQSSDDRLFPIESLHLTSISRQLITSFVTECKEINNGFIALINRKFPIFLVPNPEADFQTIFKKREIVVRIFWDSEGWYINSANSNVHLFSFDLPEEVLRLYMEGDILSPRRALDLKAQNFGEIQLISTLRGRIEFVTLRLDTGWLNELRRRIN